MSDDDLIRRGDALFACLMPHEAECACERCTGRRLCHQAIQGIPAAGVPDQAALIERLVELLASLASPRLPSG